MNTNRNSTVEGTNTLLRNNFSIKKDLYYESKNRSKRMGKILFSGRKTCICSKCGFKMDKEMGDRQIKNKRKNAPICVACILGNKRNPEKQKAKREDLRKSVEDIGSHRREFLNLLKRD